MCLLSNTNVAGYSEKGVALTESDAALRQLNNVLDKVAVPYVVNEGWIENCLDKLETQNKEKNPVYWLLLVRLNELALLCAGNYADNCEFSAAGDLLVNPKKKFVHFKNARKPLLPYLFKKMRNSGRVSGSYLDLAGTHMKRIIDTMIFLASWKISDASELYRRISGSTPEKRAFIESNLCLFKNDLFFTIGNEVRLAADNPCYRSDFLAYISFVFPDDVYCLQAS